MSTSNQNNPFYIVSAKEIFADFLFFKRFSEYRLSVEADDRLTKYIKVKLVKCYSTGVTYHAGT